ncbi:MAG: cytochrome C [Comamonadaceae bacterium CG_4_10_14_0_8_um_filter_57_29]|nr:MAG: cytochrome C [Comamonadaceae bacterium CG_4_10_14_0_8_um_filter_57_29]
MKIKLLTLLVGSALTTAVMAADVTYRTDIAALVKARCADCHGAESPALSEFLTDQKKYKKEKVGPRLTSYEDLVQLAGWPESGALMRRLDDGAASPGNKPGNMYRHLGETDEERASNLKLIKDWVGEGGWNLNRWEVAGDVPAISKEQMSKLLLKY